MLLRRHGSAGISRLRLLTFRTESTCVRSIPKSCCDPCGECFPPRPLFGNRSPGAGDTEGACFGCVPSPDEFRKRRKHRSLGAKIFRDDPFVGRSNITELSFALQDICHFRIRFSDVAPLFFARRAFGRFRGPVFCPGFAAEIPAAGNFPLSVVFSPPTFPTSETKNALPAAEFRTPSEAILCLTFCTGCECDAGSDGVPCRKSVVFVLPLRRCFSSRMTADRAPAGRVWRTVRSLSPVAVAETAAPEHVPVSASASTGTGETGAVVGRMSDVPKEKRASAFSQRLVSNDSVVRFSVLRQRNDGDV